MILAQRLSSSFVAFKLLQALPGSQQLLVA